MSFDFKLDPFENFRSSLKAAQLKGIPEHNAMSIATVNSSSQPSVRIVYYKGLIRGGFSFYTNYQGRKSLDLEINPNICANFFWPHLDEQIRISGIVEKLTESESDQYFATRARLSQIGAWASLQSQDLQSFDQFRERLAELEKKYAGVKVPRPPHWGGFRIVPFEIEFWFGRDGRLHERYVYSTSADGWKRSLRFP
jgi:pyridoxamine 5'-phosphate oxidase